MSLNVKQILVEYLKSNGYDGLCNWGCGCGIDNLNYDNCISSNCKAAVKRVATIQDNANSLLDFMPGQVGYFEPK